MAGQNKKLQIKKINSNQSGFTLIELLVVVAIIALLSAVALVAFQSGRQKSRDAKRLSDMAQMNTGLGLFFASNKGYPSSTSGIPAGLIPSYASTLPINPQPPDGNCAGLTYPLPVPPGTLSNQYYYVATGTSYLAPDNVTTVYSDFVYYFCLGKQTGSFGPGVHVMAGTGVQ